MITTSNGAFLYKKRWIDSAAAHALSLRHPDSARKGSMTWQILSAHSAKAPSGDLRITFDALASHDITYVGIVQTARAGGMQRFPLHYVLTNCHNSLCAVGGTINEDDHLFGLSAAKKYGGDYVPAHMAVIHQYVREMLAGCGKMILGSDSHTRYGALGCMGVGEGGPELVKQLLGCTYDLPTPEATAVYLTGSPRPGVGPQDVALALIGAVFKAGTVKNKVLEFIGPGIENLSVEYRLGIDVMTTETACLSSIWQTDAKVRDWLAAHGREADYQQLVPEDGTWYDSVIHVDLDRIEPMIALPFHPSNTYTIREFLANAESLLADVEVEAAGIIGNASARPNLRSKLKNDGFMVDQGIVAGCSGGTYENLARVAAMLRGGSTGNNAFALSVYPASQPQYLELLRSGHATALMEAGVTLKTAFCGPCFGAGDVPAHNAFSIRHTTRNFPNREGSKPSGGQIAYVALMDARSIAATALNKGKLTAATDLATPPEETPIPYLFNPSIYERRVYRGFGRPDPQTKLIFGPNIADWPRMPPLPENLFLTVVAAIYDPITTTDELIPSGETSSYRSNPLKLAEFALSRKDPEYVGRAKTVLALEEARKKMLGYAPAEVNGKNTLSAAAPYTASPTDVESLFARLGVADQKAHTGIGSLVFALKPGDGSAREQAASCQKVLGGWGNIAEEYATKRYRANLINWGMLPFILDNARESGIEPGDSFFLPSIRKLLLSDQKDVPATLFRKKGGTLALTLRLPSLSKDERDIILAGCLINYYQAR